MAKTTMEEFVRRGLAAQEAVDQVLLDVQGTTGGKATVETMSPRRRTDSFDKIRLKGAPKQYKTGTPGVTGRARIEARVRKLAAEAERFAIKAGREADAVNADWANALAHSLRWYLKGAAYDRPAPPPLSR
jgi:hypothetical protein